MTLNDSPGELSLQSEASYSRNTDPFFSFFGGGRVSKFPTAGSQY